MKKLTLFAASALMGSLLFSGTAYAFPGGHGAYSDHRMGKGRIMHKVLHKLDLTDEQEVQVKEIMAERKMSPDAQAMHRSELMSELEVVIQAENWDEAAAKALIEKKHRSRENQALAQMRAMHDIYQVLTDEQKEKLQKMKRKMQMHFREDAEY